MNMSDYTKNLLADTLLSLFEKNDLENIRVGEICSLSGVSRKTFYNHFQDKYELMSWIMTRKYQAAFDSADLSAQDQVELFYKAVLAEKKFYHRLFSDPRISQLLNYFLNFNCEIYETAVKDFYKLNELNDEYIFSIKFFVYGGLYMTRDWILSGFSLSPTDFASRLYEQMPPFLKKIYN